METKSINRWSPLKLPNGRTLRNRVVIPPMASQTADEAGFVTTKTLEHYGRLSEAQPGLLIAEYTFVHLSGKSEDNQLGIQSDAHVNGLAQLASLIQASGALAGIQITHGGGKTRDSPCGGSDADFTDSGPDARSPLFVQVQSCRHLGSKSIEATPESGASDPPQRLRPRRGVQRSARGWRVGIPRVLPRNGPLPRRHERWRAKAPSAPASFHLLKRLARSRRCRSI